MSTTLIDPSQWEGIVRHANERGRYLLDDLSANIRTWQEVLHTPHFAIYDQYQVPLCGFNGLSPHPNTILYRVPVVRHGETVATIVSPQALESLSEDLTLGNLILQLTLTLADLTEWAETEAERRGEKVRLVEEYGMTVEVQKLLALCGLYGEEPLVMVAFELGLQIPFQNMEILRRYVIAHTWRYRYEFPWIAYRSDGIMTLTSGSSVESILSQVEELARVWGKAHPELPVRAYVSMVPDLAQFAEALRETRTVMQFCARYGLSGVVNRAVNRHYIKVLADMSPGGLEQLVNTILGPLLQEDHEILLRTLDTYLANGQSLTKTGHILYVHPNTALYRIRQAEKLLGIDLKNTEQMTSIWIALQGRKLLGSHQPSKVHHRDE